MSDIEFYFCLCEGEPVLIGGASHDGFQEIVSAASDIPDDNPGGVIGSRTRAIMEELGHSAGVGANTEAALDYYEEMGRGSRTRFLEKLAAPED